LLTNRTFLSHGVAIGVRTNDPTLLERAESYFPPDWEATTSVATDACYSLVRTSETTGVRARYELFEGDRKLDEGFRLSQLLDSMDSAIREEVGRRTPQRLFVHAGVVAWKQRAIVIPGLSGAGKTTLVASLLRAGATYMSDEYAVLDAQGRVHPYARPMSFRQGAHRRIRRDAADLGGRVAETPAPVGLVVLTKYRPDAVWAPSSASPGESALGILANVLVARERPAFALAVLAQALAGADTLAGDRGEADAAAADILSFTDRLTSFTQGTNS
jgi:hypothetical protein